jgi:hypothetical protein
VVKAGGRKLRLVAPDEPPRLTPGAAKVLLRILLKARDQRDARQQTADQTTRS